MQEPVFVVHCLRVRKTSLYQLRFPINDQLTNRIKELPHASRKWVALEYAWEVNTAGLYLLIKRYKGSNKIHFDFGNEESRKIFIQQIKKVEAAEEEKRKFIADLNIKKEHWVKYKQELEATYIQYSDKMHALLKEGVKLYPHQIVAAMFMNVTRNTLISHEMGLGKCQPLYSKLLTPNGWIQMGDINVGEYVIGSDGKPKKVLGVFPQGVKNIYEVCFNDGTSTRCCDEHLWNVNTYIRNWRKNPFQTKTLRDIMNEGMTFKNGNHKHYIPIVKPIEFEKKEFKIDPYVLGCLLGDGSIISKYEIGFSSIDKEMIDEISTRLPVNHNMVISGKSLKDYYLTADGKNNYINQALKLYELKGCNSYTKFIPHIYKFSSIEQRLEILQGILDTDGHSRMDGIIELTLASKQLIEDVQFIVQSLGGIGRLHEKWVKYKGIKRLYWRLQIKLPPEFIPFKLSRKIETFVAPTKYLPNRAISEIKYVGKELAQCILVDSDDHLYVTDNCILTHNTLSSILYVEMNGFEKVVVITPNSLKFNFFNEVEKFTNSNSHIVGWRKNKCSIENAKYIIVNYDFFNSGKKEKFLAKWQKLGITEIDAVICDECFPYETPIQTTAGILNIGDIVDNKLDVQILSYNHKLKKIELKSIKRYLYRGYKNVIKIKLSNGTIIECTPEHKFYSIDRDKYIPISEFNIGERLYEYKKEKNSNKNGNMSTLWKRVQAKTKFTNFVFKKMFYYVYKQRKCNKGIKNKKIKRKSIANGRKKMPILQKIISITRKIFKKILLNKLFCKMENGTTRNKKKGIYEGIKSENFKSNFEELCDKSRIKRTSLKKNDEKQPNVSTNKYREDERKKRKIYFSFKRWKWSNNKTTIITFFQNIWRYIYGNGISNTNTYSIEKVGYSSCVATNTLQSRYWNTEFEISDRGGWKYSQNKKMEISGQKKNRNLSIVRVENIEILESGDRERFKIGGCQNKRVYDLEVEDNHNFFANGILVSNCQKLKNTKANTYKNFNRTFNKLIFKSGKISKIFLSGTPAPNRAYELYTVLNQISPLDFPTKEYFYEYYCGMIYDHDSGWGYITNSAEAKLEELYHKAAPYTHRKRKFEVLTDLPDKIYQRVILEMTDEEYATYDEIEEGVANEFVLHPNGNPLTTMLRLRQYTASLKVKHIVELIENILETGEKVVIVDFFKDALYQLKEKLGNVAALHTGDQSDEERSEIVKKFQDPNSDLKIFLGNIQTCGYGLTLTAASKLFLITLPYSVGDYDQVSDRLHRIGQKAVVNIYPLIFPDTIDDYVYSSIESKRKEITKVMDNEEYVSNVEESVLSDVIKKIKEKHGKPL